MQCLHAMARGDVRVMLALGGNFVAATPDSRFVEDAIRRCELTVQVSTKLNRSHLVTGQTALILPVLGRTEIDRQAGVEQFVTVENSMGVVTPSRGLLPPASDYLKSEVRLVAELADVTVGGRVDIDWLGLASDYSQIRDHIGRVIPGFENFNYRIGSEGSIELPHPVRDERRFPTASGKAMFTVHSLPPVAAPEGHYLLTTLRSHDQFNTTVYSQNDRYRGIAESRWVVFMNPDDMADIGLTSGQRVDLCSGGSQQERRLCGLTVVPYRIPRGCVAAYYPEANPLVPVSAVARGSNTPAYKSIPVRITRQA
jgi:molybdopterin-dependent oxidoreductase alpha subunit